MVVTCAALNKVDLLVSFPPAVNDLSFQAIAGHPFSLHLNESGVESVTPLSSIILTFLCCSFMQINKRFSSAEALGLLSCNPVSFPGTPAARGIQSILAGKKETSAVTL